MTETKKLSLKEQVEIIQKVLNDPRFFDEDQLIEAGIKNKTTEKEVKLDE